jgi:hypothetical protein
MTEELAQLRAENSRLRDKLLELANECTDCGGTGVQTIFTFRELTAEERQQPCDACADIREVLE